MNRKWIFLIMLVAVAVFGVAFAGIESDAANKTADILCPIVNVTTGTVGRLIILALVAVAVVMYFTIDARTAKGLAITAAIGALLLGSFATIQKVFTGYDLDTETNAPTRDNGKTKVRVDMTNKIIYCKE